MISDACTRCWAEPAESGSTRCAGCIEWQRAYDAERRAGGPCVDCRRASRERGRTRCGICRAAKAAKERKLSQERRKAGLCVTCGAGAVEGLTLCAIHREYYRARNQRT